jgi:hypothetical protein
MKKKSNRYLNSKNKLVYCLKCGKSVIYKGKKPFKYCKQWGKEIKNNNDRIRIKTIRDNM